MHPSMCVRQLGQADRGKVSSMMSNHRRDLGRAGSTGCSAHERHKRGAGENVSARVPEAIINTTPLVKKEKRSVLSVMLLQLIL